jgi:hypothetical protein
MFRSHAGFRGCAFLRDGAECTVVTLWDGAGDIVALETSEHYRDTVAAIMGTGFIRGAADPITVPVIP